MTIGGATYISTIFPAEKCIEYQKIDMDLNFLISWKEKGEKPVWETVSPCSPAVKYHWSRWDTLYLKAGILYRKVISHVIININITISRALIP
jgi:hypothetical protein